jgi:hypothetical protein
LRAAALNISLARIGVSGGSGYSFARGASNGLPPAWIWPLILPALPETAAVYSNLS